MKMKVLIYSGVGLMALAFVWLLFLSGGAKPIFMWPLVAFLFGEFTVLVCIKNKE